MTPTPPVATVCPTGAGPLPGARPALALLMGINLLNYIDRYVLAAVVPHIEQTRPDFFAQAQQGDTALARMLGWIQQTFGFTPHDALMGSLSTAFMATYMVGAPVFGRLAERHARWALIGLGVIVWSLASGASGLAGTFLILLMTRCLVGIGEAAYGPVAPAMISDFYPVQQRGRVLALFYMAIPVGSALGYMIGDVVARSALGRWGHEWLGWASESWRWAFYLVVLPGLVLGIWSLFMRDAPRGLADRATVAGPERVRWRDYRILWRTPSYVLCSVGMTAMTFAMGGISFWMPYYLTHYRKAGEASTTIFGGIVVVAGLTATLLGGLAGDRLRRRFPGSYFLVSGAAMLLGFPFFLATLRAQEPFWIYTFIFLSCFCLFFNTGPTNTIIANVTHPAMRATAFALNIFLIHALGDVISPLVIGIVSDRSGGNLNRAFLVVGAMFLVSATCWLLGARFLARDTELAGARLQTENEAPALP